MTDDSESSVVSNHKKDELEANGMDSKDNQGPLNLELGGSSCASSRRESEINANTFNYAKTHEPNKVRKWRYFSVGVICFTAFIYALSFSIVLNSSKPYLDKMDPDAGTRFLGVLIASQAVAQLISSPLMGFLGNRFGSIRVLLMISIFITGGGFAFYASVSLLPPPRRWYLLSSRFIMGLAGGSSTLCYSYVASATTVKERSTALSILQASKSLAFIAGPCNQGLYQAFRRLMPKTNFTTLLVIQASFLPFGTGEDYPIGDTGLYWNVYTAPAWLAVLLCLMNIAVLLPCVFTEYHMAKEEGDFLSKMHLEKEEGDDKQGLLRRKKPDKAAMIVCILLFSIFQFHFNILESLSSLLTMEQLGMSPEESIFSLSIFFAAAGVYNTLCFAAVGYLAKRVQDRVILTFGLLCVLLGPLCMYPYGGPPPPLKAPNITDTLSTTMTPMTTINTKAEFYLRPSFDTALNEIVTEFPEECANTTILYNGGGCPADKQEWCCDTPAIHPAQIMVGFILLLTALPSGITMSNGILSKILGPYPQGTWTGMLGAGSAAARILCPISVTNLYSSFGTGPTFAFLNAILLASALVYVIFYKRLVPYRYELPTTVSTKSIVLATDSNGANDMKTQ